MLSQMLEAHAVALNPATLLYKSEREAAELCAVEDRGSR